MAPSVSPISSALLVPMAWAAVPMATPLAMGSVMRSRRNSPSPNRLPTMPVRMTTAPVRDAMPPSSADTSMLMAVVTDLGSSVTNWVWSSPMAQPMSSTLARLVRVPAAMPARMALALRRKISHFSYSGTASDTVAGSSSQLTGAALALYWA